MSDAGRVPPWFWKREDLYRWNGRCCYAGECDEYSESCEPEECEIWDMYYDGEVQMDEILENSDW